jgi:plastocyanin
MSDRRARRRIAGALAGAALIAAVMTGTAIAADTAVAISGFAFVPPAVTVTVGDTVTWTNSDGVGHTATADDASFTTGTIAGGASDSVTFSTAGTFAYHCAIHPAMTGTITVEAAAGGGGATATTPPTDTAAIAGASPVAQPGGWIALFAIAGSWIAGIIAVWRRFAGPNGANHSWTDSSAANRADVEAPPARG